MASLVMRGLDPRIHQNESARSKEMDCRVKPGNDESHYRFKALRLGYCVLATCGGTAWVMNWVASSMAVPSGVGITIR